MKRVLVLTQGFPRHPDDHHATFVLDHARALTAAGATVTVICPSSPGLARHDTFGEISVVRFRYAPRRLETLAYTGAMHRRARGWRSLLLPAFVLGFLIESLRQARGHDVVHGHWWIPSGLIAVVCGGLVGLPAVVQLHGTDVAMARGPLRLLARWVLRKASAVVAVSRAASRWCADLAGVDATVLPMPLATDRLPAPSPPPADGPVLAVGRLVPEKGFDVLVRAAAEAGQRVVIAGAGDQHGALEALALERGAALTLLGAVPPKQLAELYASARLVCVPSRREGFGLVAAEAAAAGRAVIASDVGGLPDVVHHGSNGVLVPPGDASALAAALKSTDPALGRNGPATVASLTPAAVGAATLALYDRCSAAPPALRRTVRNAAAAVAVLAVGLAVAALVRQWDEARGLEVQWRPDLLAGASVCVLAAHAGMAWAWGWLVRAAGAELPPANAFRIWWSGQLGRYLPTGLGSVPARAVLARSAGVPARVAAVATAVEPAVVVAACGVVAATLVHPVLGLAAGIVGGGATAFAVSRALGTSHVQGAMFFLLQIAQVGLRSVGIWICLGLFTRPDHPPLLLVTGAVGLSYAVGFLAVFAPGGIGVREASLAGTLAASVGAPAAVGAAVVWRLLELGGELLMLTGSRLISSRPARAPSAPEPTAP